MWQFLKSGRTFLSDNEPLLLKNRGRLVSKKPHKLKSLEGVYCSICLNSVAMIFCLSPVKLLILKTLYVKVINPSP